MCLAPRAMATGIGGTTAEAFHFPGNTTCVAGACGAGDANTYEEFFSDSLLSCSNPNFIQLW